jgi:hypothetical protein
VKERGQKRKVERERKRKIASEKKKVKDRK